MIAPASCNSRTIGASQRTSARCPTPTRKLWPTSGSASRRRFWAGGKSRPLAITLDGELIGGIGVGTKPDRSDEEWELGYWLGEPYWNRGYASEAAIAVRDYAFEVVGLQQIVAGHYADNHASGRVLTKLGFRYYAEAQRYCLARGTNVRCLEMALPRERWSEIKAGVGARRTRRLTLIEEVLCGAGVEKRPAPSPRKRNQTREFRAIVLLRMGAQRRPSGIGGRMSERNPARW